MDKIQQLIEVLIDILQVTFLRARTRQLLMEISSAIMNRSTEIISSYMESLSVTDLDMSLDFIVDPETDTDTILEYLVEALMKNTIPFTLAALRTIPGITQSRAKHILAKIWYKWFVSKDFPRQIFHFINFFC